MTNQEKIEEHIKDKCKYCPIQDCDGFHFTIYGETRCERDVPKI